MADESLDVRLARIETKLDAHLVRTDDHEQRLRKIESLMWKAVGAASVAGGALATVAQTLLGGN